MRLNQITVPTDNIGASVDFYRQLGFRQIVDAPHYARFLAPEGDTTFSVHVQDELPAERGAVIYLETDSVDEVYARLIKSDIVFKSPPTDESWLWREARLLDPAGNEVCIYHAGENRINPPWRIAGTQE